MRRLRLMVSMLLIPALLVSFVSQWVFRTSPPERGEQLLRLYLHEVGGERDLDGTTYLRSRKPNQFAPTMSHDTYSEGWYYQTARALLRPANTPDPLSSNIRSPGLISPNIVSIDSSLNVNKNRSSGMRSLIYPPVEAWCVEIQPANSNAVTYLLLAQHQDLYNAEWVVHELSTDKQQTEQILDTIGCNI